MLDTHSRRNQSLLLLCVQWFAGVVHTYMSLHSLASEPRVPSHNLVDSRARSSTRSDTSSGFSPLGDFKTRVAFAPLFPVFCNHTAIQYAARPEGLVPCRALCPELDGRDALGTARDRGNPLMGLKTVLADLPCHETHFCFHHGSPRRCCTYSEARTPG